MLILKKTDFSFRKTSTMKHPTSVQIKFYNLKYTVYFTVVKTVAIRALVKLNESISSHKRWKKLLVMAVICDKCICSWSEGGGSEAQAVNNTHCYKQVVH